ncbi:hypothetical protein B5F20_14640 [Clostridium perfringens]|uniref:helix-turn-helix domain-containing protein n=1 Tax=Clostridium perfringens TaxID=1502 RepID=UPI000B37A76E|nr:hypothetical protein [Clostridium perfringens]OUP40980.1 hypothetical protein B5F20_14640 [Clostridium perfringens]
MNYDYNYLRGERLKKGLQIRQISEKIPMDESNYGKLERGDYKNIPCYILARLKEILDLDLNKFIC